MVEGWDQSKFEEVLGRYLAETSKSMPEAINQKAYFVARKALWFTKKVERSQIRGELGRNVTIRRTTASGRVVRRRGLELAPSRANEKISLAKMILAKRYRKRGDWPKDATEWEKRIRALIGVRERSTAFLKSGWLQAIKFLAGFVTSKSGAPVDSSAVNYGSNKGSAIAATEANGNIATIVNAAIARHDKKNSLQKYGAKALDLAFYDETQSMIEYLEQKMAKGTARANANL
jgi:hypothetical protein